MSISVSETQTNGMKISSTHNNNNNNNNNNNEVVVVDELVKCDCCGMKEECTQAYIDQIRDMYKGRWICGLCSEAIQEEIIRSERLISIEEALNRQMNFRNKFRCSTPPTNTKADLIIAIRELFRRSLDSPRSVPSSPHGRRRNEDHHQQIPSLSRSESCFPALAG